MCDPILGSIPRTGGLPLTPEISFPLVFSAFPSFDTAAEIMKSFSPGKNCYMYYYVAGGQGTALLLIFTQTGKKSFSVKAIGQNLCCLVSRHKLLIIWKVLRNNMKLVTKAVMWIYDNMSMHRCAGIFSCIGRSNHAFVLQCVRIYSVIKCARVSVRTQAFSECVYVQRKLERQL